VAIPERIPLLIGSVGILLSLGKLGLAQAIASRPQTVSRISWRQAGQLYTRICVSLRSGDGSIFAVRMACPQRHSGNSLKPGTVERSKADVDANTD
jgi:hypothetical protein